jgi:uracil-DNA glycosylase/uncharacterized protein YeaO (DUF488 family)
VPEPVRGALGPLVDWVSRHFFRAAVSNVRPLRGPLTRPLIGPLPALLAEIRACNACGDALPLGPRPVLQASATSSLLIVGQAPGAKVHASGIPWDDASGKRLRGWLGIDSETFYDAAQVALVPMGFCYPGRGGGGDNPPRPECAPLWHARLIEQLGGVRLTLLVGQYAQRYFLGNRRKASLTETVEAWRDYAPNFVPLPHPSPRNQAWFKRHPWFDEEIVPVLQERVRALLKPTKHSARPAIKDPTMTKPVIALQRVYEPLPEERHGCFLVDRLWPRGMRKEALEGVEWVKEAAPSTALRQWYHKDLSQWDEFRQRYLAELDANPAGWQPLAEAAAEGPVMLLYGSHDAEHNHAIVLRDFLLKHTKRK